MLQQNIEDEATPKYGGSRWKSARPDKGSVTSYAKDIQEKHRRKIEDPALKSQSAPRSASQKEKVPLDFRSKGKTPDKENIFLKPSHTVFQSNSYVTNSKFNKIMKILSSGQLQMFLNGLHLRS